MSIATGVRELQHPSLPPRRVGLVDGLSIGAAAAPFLVVGLVYGLTGHLVLGGDQALIGLDALDARHLDQAVGPYSRMGWAHPGPAWTYLLAPLWWLFGSTGQALIAASLLVHALTAALVVLAAGGERPWQRPLVAALLLVYVLRMPAIVFVNIWNPFALLLPTMVFLLVAARACAGSLAALTTTVLVGSYLLQTHVGTAPLIGLVGVTALVVIGIRLVRRRPSPPNRAEWIRIGAAAAGVLMMWLPPVWQQLSATSIGQGNLGMLAHYFVAGPATEEQTHTWTDAFSAVGQLLGAPVYGWPATPAPVNTSIVTAAVMCAVLVQVAGGLVVGALALRAGQLRTGWLALLTVAAVAAGLAAGRTVTGVLQNYLLLWVTTLPAVLLFAGASLVLQQWRPVQGLGILHKLAAAGTAASVVLAVGVTLSLQRSARTQLPSQPAVEEAAALLLDALPPVHRGDPPVLFDMADVSVWTTATSVALDLELAGHRVSVNEEWVYSFGQDRKSAGNEHWRATIVPVFPGEARLPGQLGVVTAINGPAAVLLERISAG